MRIPQPNELRTQQARTLYGHDLAEFPAAGHETSYSRMQGERRQRVLAVARRVAGVGRILDLGCAQGNTALLLAEEGFNTWAVDLRVDFLVYAGLKHERGLFRRCAANAAMLPFPDGFFDLVIWGEMIEHVAFPEQMLGEISRVLRPGSHLLLTTPNGERLHTRLPTFTQVKDRAPLAARQFEPDSDGHLFLFTHAELVHLLETSGFQVLEHAYYATPWITGRLGSRYLIGWMPPGWRASLDRLALRFSPLSAKIAEGHALLARRA